MIRKKAFAFGIFLFTLIINNPVAQADDNFEPNNDFYKATLINRGSYRQLFCDGEDWYKIYIESDRTIIIAIEINGAGSRGDFDIELYNENEARMIGSYEMNYNTYKERLCYYIKNSGLYFIRIYSYREIGEYDMVITIEDGNTCTQEEGIALKPNMEFLYEIKDLNSKKIRSFFGENWKSNALFPNGAYRIGLQSKINITSIKEVINNSIQMYEILYNFWDWRSKNQGFSSKPNMTNQKCWSYKTADDYNKAFPEGLNEALTYIPVSVMGFLKGVKRKEGWKIGQHCIKVDEMAWSCTGGSTSKTRMLTYDNGSYHTHWVYYDYGWIKQFRIESKYGIPIYSYSVEPQPNSPNVPKIALKEILPDSEIFFCLGFILIPICCVVYIFKKNR